MKQRGFVLLLCVCLTLTGCTGLPTAREMGDMALLRTMGVDSAGQEVQVTVSTGPRAKGLQAEGEAALVLSAKRESLSAACLAMQSLSDSYVFYGYVDQLLLGEELAKAGIKPVLDYFARDVELGLGAQLWLIRGGTAGDAVSSGGDEGVEGRLSTLQTDGKLGVAAISRTAGEVYTDMMERGAAFVPALSSEGEEDASLSESGYAVFTKDRLAGYLEGEAARGLEILAGRASAEVLTVTIGDNLVSGKMIAASTVPKLTFEQGIAVGLKLNCRVDINVTEYRREMDQGERAAFRDALEKRLLARLEETLERLRQWQADCVGLGLRAGMAHPGKWRAIEEEWPVWFGELEPEVSLQVIVHD